MTLIPPPVTRDGRRHMTTLGIDIGGSSVKAAARRDGQALWTGQSGRYTRPGRGELLAAIREAVGGRGGGVTRVGLCVPGLLDERKQRVALSVNVPGLVGVPLAGLVAEAVGGRVERLAVANDSNATAWDLYTVRKLTGRLLAIVIGTGVGAAVAGAGGLLFVDGESPGHLGQVDVSLEGEPVVGPDGGAGSLEGYVGSAALARRYAPEGGDAISRIRPGDPPLRALARAIRICHAVYRPHHVCLAGGTGIRMGHLLPGLRALVGADLTSVARPGWTLSTGDSDFHAAIGAAKLAEG